jgi:hypothetical protein
LIQLPTKFSSQFHTNNYLWSYSSNLNTWTTTTSHRRKTIFCQQNQTVKSHQQHNLGLCSNNLGQDQDTHQQHHHHHQQMRKTATPQTKPQQPDSQQKESRNGWTSQRNFSNGSQQKN